MIDQGKAETIVLLSAVAVGGGYLYRRVSEGEPHEERYSRKGSAPFRYLGQGELLPTGRFVTGFGVSFVVISGIASIAPELGASIAGLVAVGSLFFNGQAVARDVQMGLGSVKRSPSVPGSAGALSGLSGGTGLQGQLSPLPGVNLRVPQSPPRSGENRAPVGVSGSVLAGFTR